MAKCSDLENLDYQNLKTPKVHECEECTKTGDRWVHLRTCQICGVTLCCDSSPNKHTRKHFEQHGHGVIISAEPGEQWAYCFEHDSFSAY